jgi:hypothetical protein
MRNRFAANALVAALCVLSASLAGAQQAGQTSPEQTVTVTAVAKGAISKWFRAESQHLIVYSDAAEEDVTELLDNLEKLDHLLRIYTRPIRDGAWPEQKLTLYYGSRLSELGEIDEDLPADAVGLYSSCASGVRGFAVHIEHIAHLGDAQLEKYPLNESLSYAFEAYARHFLYRHTDIRAPTSFIDGFAQYFSSIRFSDKQMVVGRVPTSIGEYLGFLDDGRRYSLEYTDVLEQNDAHAHNYGGVAGVRLEFEAKAWLLTHYMLSSDDKRKRLNRYLGLVDHGLSPTVAFERAFGLKASDIGEAMWRYRLRGMEALRVEPPSLPRAQVRFHSLPLAAGEFILADAALKSCPSQQAGEALLKRVASLARRFPNDNLGRLALSRAQIDWGHAEDALPLLSAALQDDGSNFEASYLLGVSNLRLARQSEGDARRAYLQAAQGHLQRALGLNPQSSEAALAAFKAGVLATDDPGRATLDAVMSAWQTARDVDALGRSAALAYAYAGNAAEAERVLGSLAQNVRDMPMAQWAKQWRRRLDAGASRGDILAEMRRDGAPDVSFKEWTIDKESVMQTVARNYGMENAASFVKDMTRGNRGVATNGLSNGAEKR